MQHGKQISIIADSKRIQKGGILFEVWRHAFLFPAINTEIMQLFEYCFSFFL